MTCIAGVAENGRVWIGGDSAGLAGWSLRVRADEKVFRKGEFVFGFTDSFRMGDILRFAFTPPKHKNHSNRAYLSTVWIDALRQALTEAGFKKTDSGREAGCMFLVGYRGALYFVGSDFQVGEAADGFDAVGCGGDIAMGALYAAKGTPRARVLTALRASERFNGGVRGPFKVVSA